MTARVIINADDFGLSPGVNRGILEAFREGVLTSTTMLVNLDFFRDAVEIARRNPDLPVGIHLTLLWGRPVSDPAHVASLVERDGAFPRSLVTLARRYFTGRLEPAHVRTEFRRQIDAFRETGLVPTHVDTHKHVHCLPGVLEALVSVAGESGIDRVRLPAEAPLRLRPPGARRPLRFGRAARAKRNLIRFLCRKARPRLRKAGLVSTDHFMGIEQMERLSAEVLRAMLAGARPGSTEIMCHPGYADEQAGAWSRTPPHRELELRALKDHGVRETVAANGIHLIHFGEL